MEAGRGTAAWSFAAAAGKDEKDGREGQETGEFLSKS